jgi:hypothetical protein
MCEVVEGERTVYGCNACIDRNIHTRSGSLKSKQEGAVCFQIAPTEMYLKASAIFKIRHG